MDSNLSLALLESQFTMVLLIAFDTLNSQQGMCTIHINNGDIKHFIFRSASSKL